MSIRMKTLVLFAVGLTSAIVVLFLVSSAALEPSYARLEERSVRTNVERALAAIEVQLDVLSTTNHDWSAWDDTCEFVQTRSRRYIESNLTDDSLANIGVDMMVFTDEGGDLVCAKRAGAELLYEDGVPAGLEAHLAPGSLLLTHTGPGSVHRGVLSLPSGPMFISARPIVPSSEEAPVMGTLLMGVYVDDAVIDEIAATTRLSLQIVTTTTSEVVSEVKEPAPPQADIQVIPVNADTVEGRAAMQDVYGKPVAVLTVTLDRSIHAEGQHTRQLTFAIIALLGGGFALLLVAVLDRTVLRRVARLAREVQACGEGGDFSTRVAAAGDDEIGDLARAINNTLDALWQTHAKLVTSHGNLEQTTADLRRTDQELRRTANQLRRLTRHLQSVREEERALVASEMHDHIGQALTTLRMDLSTLTKAAAREGVPATRTLDEMARTVDSLMETVKRLSVGLYPNILGDLGLNEAMEWQLTEFGKQKGIHTSLSVRGDTSVLDSSRALVLFRILQESLAEMAGHSTATEVLVTLTVESRYVLLAISDNGKPISNDDPQSGRAIALGLIKDRAEVLGGGVTLTSDESGTAIVTQLPL